MPEFQWLEFPNRRCHGLDCQESNGRRRVTGPAVRPGAAEPLGGASWSQRARTDGSNSNCPLRRVTAHWLWWTLLWQFQHSSAMLAMVVGAPLRGRSDVMGLT